MKLKVIDVLYSSYLYIAGLILMFCHITSSSFASSITEETSGLGEMFGNRNIATIRSIIIRQVEAIKSTKVRRVEVILKVQARMDAWIWLVMPVNGAAIGRNRIRVAKKSLITPDFTTL